MGDLPAKQGYRSHQILDFARMGEQQGNQNHPSIGRSFDQGVLPEALPDRQDMTLKLQKQLASSYK
jgi:hypothetical protein